MKYVCEECEQPFYSEKACKQHEEEHFIEKLKKSAPDDSIICPTCKGEGSYYGNDGCNYRVCYTCKSKRFVIPETVNQTIYHPIGGK